ncbi:hypothetical protein PROFUN_09088 [Planoprotostelium fungivorum]|uniref:Uncharacterized protein n=1 Tax=Planoprotostelium fungivorum TaxID=1890364 RepID=A0A2P6NIG8_9EUKA|nr:hypothetical protein PROFUN_09088 [Planoprotostelium fungivorum]
MSIRREEGASSKNHASVSADQRPSSAVKLQPLAKPAPIALVQKFLRCLQVKNYKEAAIVAQEVLSYEPENQLILSFQSTLDEHQVVDAELKAVEEEYANEYSDSEEEGEESDSEDEEQTNKEDASVHKA